MRCQRIYEHEMPKMEKDEIDSNEWLIDPAPGYDSDEERPLAPAKYIRVVQRDDRNLLYGSDACLALVAIQRKYAQTNTTDKGLTPHSKHMISCIKEIWPDVCPNLKPSDCEPVFPKNYSYFWLVYGSEELFPDSGEINLKACIEKGMWPYVNRR